MKMPLSGPATSESTIAGANIWAYCPAGSHCAPRKSWVSHGRNHTNSNSPAPPNSSRSFSSRSKLARHSPRWRYSSLARWRYTSRNAVLITLIGMANIVMAMENCPTSSLLKKAVISKIGIAWPMVLSSCPGIVYFGNSLNLTAQRRISAHRVWRKVFPS